MVKPRQLSFRRILASRILILSVPVLLIGEFVAFRKAHNSMLETARKNSMENASLTAEKIIDMMATLKSNISSASQTSIVKTGTPEQIQAFVDRLAIDQRKYIECIQVVDLAKKLPIASTCGDDVIANLEFSSGIVANQVNQQQVQSQVVVPSKVVTNSLAEDGNSQQQNKLQFLLTNPVFAEDGKLRYGLAVRAQLKTKVEQSLNTLTGYTMILAEDGQILSHPIPEAVGGNIRQQVDGEKLQQIIHSAMIAKRSKTTNTSNSNNIPQEQSTPQVFSDRDGQEFLAGYTLIPNPVNSNFSPHQQNWIVLDVISLDSALYGLRGIKVILVLLTLGLIATCMIASIYLARQVSYPLEELCHYALQIAITPQAQNQPYNFRIRELNQLARAFDLMTKQLNAWAEEIESSWKEAKSANQLKSHFLATTSHEIRNPLNVIINCIRIVKDGLCDNKEEELDFLQRADETAIHLLNIINDLLDISKIEAGKLSVNLEVADLREIIKETINLQSINIQSKGLKFNVPRLEQELIVKVDRGKLKQVLINVIGNASKFTDRGSITVAVTTSTTITDQQENHQVKITVADTGIGIEPSQQQQLFRPFVMVEDSTNSRFKGTGLGLAISRNLIEMMGGTITLVSPGLHQGTTVAITLPLLIDGVPTQDAQPLIESSANNLPKNTLANNNLPKPETFVSK